MLTKVIKRAHNSLFNTNHMNQNQVQMVFVPYQLMKQVRHKQSKLFPDRKRIPGRKAKFYYGAFISLFFYMAYNLKAIKKLGRLRDRQQNQQFRKVAPIFQSIADIQYLSVQKRKFLILAQIFKEKGGAQYVGKLMQRFHQPYTWVQDQKSREVGLMGTGKQPKPRRLKILSKFQSGADIESI